MNVTVIGLGAMGGGMARSLLRSPHISTVSGFDLDSSLTETFHQESLRANKAPPIAPHSPSLLSYISPSTDVVLLVLTNESQCQATCFSDSDPNLFHLLREGAIVMVSSTVSPSWCLDAHYQFLRRNIHLCDCPMSGGVERAHRGELTIMASGESDALASLQPVLQAVATQIHVISGGVGRGSMVKVVHQLLAGTHIVVAAEALTLAAKAELDVDQFYQVVRGAAGDSWMFGDRGRRMMRDNHDQMGGVKSALDIFVKDLDIVYSEAKRLSCPIPMAVVALQQFISGRSLGLGKQEDASVVKVYELLAGVSVSGVNPVNPIASGDTVVEEKNVGDYWVLPNGEKEKVVDVGQEERHAIILSNEYTRVLRVAFPPRDTTWAHRHTEDSLYFFLVEGGLNVVNHVKGYDPACDCMDFGEVRYGTHKSENQPLVHKITNTSEVDLLCIDAELLKSPPVSNPLPLVAEHHTLMKVRERCRVYKLVLEPNESVCVSYAFFYLSVCLRGSKIKITHGSSDRCISWERNVPMGEIEWCTPTLGVTISNVGSQNFEQFIAEWR